MTHPDRDGKRRDFRFDHGEIAAAARDWGIRAPVAVKRRRKHFDRRTGLYSMKRDALGWTKWNGRDERHEIRLDSGMVAQQMLETLAHELVHCAQREHYGDDHVFTHAYKIDPEHFENEADRIAEDRWRELWPCLRFKA